MKYTLTSDEIITILAKHASKEIPSLEVVNGKKGSVKLKSEPPNRFWAEIEVKE